MCDILWSTINDGKNLGQLAVSEMWNVLKEIRKNF